MIDRVFNIYTHIYIYFKASQSTRICPFEWYDSLLEFFLITIVIYGLYPPEINKERILNTQEE